MQFKGDKTVAVDIRVERRMAATGVAADTSEAAPKAAEGRSWVSKGGRRPNLSTPCGEDGKHEWEQWTKYVKHCKKFRCTREGCGFFKKCWVKCTNVECPGCHVPAHKRW